MTDISTQDGELDARDRVLVVDDESLMRWSVSETLRRQGFAVVEAGDAESAIEVASDQRTPFGVVVLDVRRPDRDGLGLLTTLRRLMPAAHVILMTAHGSSEVASSALELGAYCVLCKPFGMSDIAAIVEQASHGCSA